MSGGLAAELDGQREREPLSLGQVSGVGVVGDAGGELVEQVATCAGVRAGFGVRGVALRGDGLQEEQVAGGLRHEADEFADLSVDNLVTSVPEIRMRPDRRGRAAVNAHNRLDFPDPLRPMRARISPRTEFDGDLTDGDQ